MSMTSPDLSNLIERCRKATGPDRDIDCAIEAWLHHNGGSPYADYNVVPTITGSMDVVTALIEKKLPGWEMAFGTCGQNNCPWACLTEPREPFREFASDAPTMEIAALEAFLLALQSQDTDHDQ